MQREENFELKEALGLSATFSVIVALLGAAFWGVWYLVFGSVPKTEPLMLSVVSLDIPSMSHWWDVPSIAIWAGIFFMIWNHEEGNRNDHGASGFFFGLGLVMTGMGFFLICSNCAGLAITIFFAVALYMICMEVMTLTDLKGREALGVIILFSWLTGLISGFSFLFGVGISLLFTVAMFVVFMLISAIIAVLLSFMIFILKAIAE